MDTKREQYEVDEETPELLEEDDAGSDTMSEEDDPPRIVLDDTASEEDEPSSQKTVELSRSMGLAGLDRAAMERERLARAHKAGLRQEPPEPPSKRQKTTHVSGEPSSRADDERAVETSNRNLQFPDGTIKWTWAKGFPKETRTITIEEVLQKDTLKAALLSGFQVCRAKVRLM
jgi:hypothetical protein